MLHARTQTHNQLTTSHTADILGKKNRSFFHRHNVIFRATDALANCVLCVFAKGSQAVG